MSTVKKHIRVALQFQQTLEETVRIHNWFATEPASPARDTVVSRVYSELFLSPLDDPWYGLSRPDVYSAIKNDGRINAVAHNSGH